MEESVDRVVGGSAICRAVLPDLRHGYTSILKSFVPIWVSHWGGSRTVARRIVLPEDRSCQTTSDREKVVVLLERRPVFQLPRRLQSTAALSNESARQCTATECLLKRLEMPAAANHEEIEMLVARRAEFV